MKYASKVFIESDDPKGTIEGENEVPKDKQELIRQYVLSHKNLDDKDFHDFVMSLGVEPEEAEEVIYKFVRDLGNK